jgi:hypothetical protein
MVIIKNLKQVLRVDLGQDPSYRSRDPTQVDLGQRKDGGGYCRGFETN